MPLKNRTHLQFLIRIEFYLHYIIFLFLYIGGDVTAQVKTPSNAMHLPHVEDNGNGSVGVFYQPTEAGPHNLDVRNNGEHVQGSPYKFYVSPNDEGKVYAYGPGLTHGVCGDSSNFVISTKGT